MKGLVNNFKDPLNLILTIMVVLSLLGAWLYGKQAPGVDYYVAWVVADAVKNDTPNNIYDPISRYKLALEYRNKVDALKDAPRQKRIAKHRNELPMTATPFLYWVTGLVATGDYETDLDTWHAISLLVLTTSILVMCHLLGYSTATSLTFFLPVLVYFSPQLSDLRVANVNSLQLGMITLIFWLQSRNPGMRKLFITGVVTGLMVMFKPNLAPVALLLAGGWAVRRQYAKLGIALSGLATGAVSAVLVSSWWLGSATAWIDWLNVINQTVTGFGKSEKSHALIKSIFGATGPSGQLGLAVFFCFLCLAFLWWGRRAKPDPTANELDTSKEALENTLLVAMGCIVMLLASALVWPHYYLLTIPMFIVVFRPWQEPGRMKILPLLMLRVLPAVALVSMLESPIIYMLGAEGKTYWSVASTGSAILLYVIGLWQFGFRLRNQRGQKVAAAPAAH
jgi:hypothetical protein